MRILSGYSNNPIPRVSNCEICGLESAITDPTVGLPSILSHESITLASALMQRSNTSVSSDVIYSISSCSVLNFHISKLSSHSARENVSLPSEVRALRIKPRLLFLASTFFCILTDKYFSSSWISLRINGGIISNSKGIVMLPSFNQFLICGNLLITSFILSERVTRTLRSASLMFFSISARKAILLLVTAISAFHPESMSMSLHIRQVFAVDNSETLNEPSNKHPGLREI